VIVIVADDPEGVTALAQWISRRSWSSAMRALT
jgi:hypothetical protein